MQVDTLTASGDVADRDLTARISMLSVQRYNGRLGVRQVCRDADEAEFVIGSKMIFSTAIQMSRQHG